MKQLVLVAFGANIGMFAAALRPECGVSPRDVAPTLVISALAVLMNVLQRGNR